MPVQTANLSPLNSPVLIGLPVKHVWVYFTNIGAHFVVFAPSACIEYAIPAPFVFKGITHYVKPAEVIAKLKIRRRSQEIAAKSFYSFRIFIQKKYMVIELAGTAFTAAIAFESHFADYPNIPVIREGFHASYLFLYIFGFYRVLSQIGSLD